MKRPYQTTKHFARLRERNFAKLNTLLSLSLFYFPSSIITVFDPSFASVQKVIPFPSFFR